MKILLADDDQHIRQILHYALQQAHYDVFEAENGQQALSLFESLHPDLVILDVNMPEMDGTDVCKQLRRVSTVPILFLSGRTDEFDRVLGLELGADDYLCKPVSPRELVARVKAILRRISPSLPPAPTSSKFLLGYLAIDHEHYSVLWNGQEIKLTATEFALLKAFSERPGVVYSRETLMNHAYGFEMVLSERTIDSHLRRIRNKFREHGGCPVETVHGVGYRLGRCDQLL